MATKLRRKDVVELLAQRTERYTPGYSGHIEDARYYWDKGGGSGPLWHLVARAKDFGLIKEGYPTKRTSSLRRAPKRRKAKRSSSLRRARTRLRRRLSQRRAMSLPRASRWRTRAAFYVKGRWKWLTWNNDTGNSHKAILDKADEIGADKWDFGGADHEPADRANY